MSCAHAQRSNPSSGCHSPASKRLKTNPLKTFAERRGAHCTPSWCSKTPGLTSHLCRLFEDAFSDIRNHQMAMLEGVRVAFESMLESFGPPKELEKGFERAAKRGFGKRQVEVTGTFTWSRFAHLGGAADDTFAGCSGMCSRKPMKKQARGLTTLARNTGKS